MVSGWFVIRTRPQREFATAAILGRRGIDVYFPIVPSTRRTGSRPRIHEALLPGYLFVYGRPDSSVMPDVRYVPNIAYILGQGETPTMLSDALIRGIQHLVELRHASARHARHECGDMVTITNGPSADVQEVFARGLTGRGRVRELLNLIQDLRSVGPEDDRLTGVS